MLQDRRAHIARVAQKAATAYAARDLRETMRCLRQLLPHRPRAMPLVQDEAGRIATTAQQASDLWHEHCANKLGADQMCFSDLAATH
eukprot:7517487-Alexandrium_andersonii.AAC.1